MKLITTLSAFFLLLFTGVYAQDVPLGMQYQAVARDLQGNILSNQTITLKISLVSNQKSHAVYYSEIHEPTTNQLGLFTLVIGGGKATNGVFSEVPWSTEDVWMQVAIKDKGKTDFATISNSKLLAVPYAFHALTASQLTNKSAMRDDGTTGNFPGVPSQNWSLFGNSNSDASKDKLGTTDYVDLVLVTNNLDRLRIKANGDIDIKRSLTIGANLDVDSSVYLNKVSGSTINYGPLTVERQSPTLLTGTLTVNQATDLKSTLNVDGITDLNSNLNVNNASPTVLSGTLRVDGITDLNNNLNVNNASPAVLSGTLRVDGVTDLNNNLNVNNASPTVLSGTLRVDGVTDLNNNLNVNNESPTLLTGILQVNKDAVFKEHVLLDNPAYNSTSITTGALVVNGGFGLGKNLFVGGDANFAAKTTFQGPVNVTDETQSTSTTTGALIVAGGTGIGKNLNVGGTSTLNGQVTIKPSLTGSDNTYNAYPLKVEGSTQGVAIKVNGTRSTNNNFVSFWDDNGMQGRIEGQTLDELHASEDYKDELASHIYDVTSGAIDLLFGGTDVAFAAADLVAALASTTPCVGLGVCETVPIVSEITAAGIKVGIAAAEELVVVADVAYASTNLDKFKQNQDAQIGVSYQSGSGDYAEYLLRADQNEKINAGDIVSVNGGKISKNTNGAGKLMVVSTSPIVLGNLPQSQFEKNYEKVAFMGQVPVKVFGKVNIGDYIIPNGMNNGVGIAVSPEKISSENIKNIVGVAWTSSVSDLQINLINVAVGINTNDNSKKVAILEKKLNDQDTEISDLKKQIAETNTLLAKLVPGFKSGSPATLATSDNARVKQNSDVAQTYQNVQGTVKSFKTFTVAREDLIKGFDIAKQMMKDKGIDVNNNPFWKKFSTDGGYKEQVLQMIQKKVDETVKAAKK